MTNPIACVICRETRTEHFLDARDYITGETFALRRCVACGLVFVWPQPADLNKYYPSFYRQYHPLVLRLFRAVQELRVRGWVRRLGKSGRAVEVGCGHGWMLSALRRRGWDVLGIERTADSARFAAHMQQLPILAGGLEALKPHGQFDLVVLHEVLEHLSNPREVLETCATLLAPGGSLIIEVPNLASWQFRFAREHWEHLFVPRHLTHFTPESLARALACVNLRVVETSFVALEYDPHSWLLSILNRLGFPQNLLLRWLAGGWRRDKASEGYPTLFTPTGLLMVLAISIMVAPSFLLAAVSWPCKAGSIMEVRAIKPLA